MKILLAPAETKTPRGDEIPYDNQNFFFTAFKNTREEVIKNYEQFLKNSSLEELSKWFGLKNISECEKYKQSILKKPLLKAILRYTGVAFDAIDYKNLSEKEKNYCDENIVIFSNLFGALKADDLIPDYKFKQGSQLPNIEIIKEYKKTMKEPLDIFLEEEVVDLRAGFYDKFYKPTANVITYKFLKNGKVVSHWAKHYRGEIVKQLAQNNITNFKQLMDLQINNLKLKEIQEKGNIKTLIMEIK